jgi:hypothetical protein
MLKASKYIKSVISNKIQFQRTWGQDAHESASDDIEFLGNDI